MDVDIDHGVVSPLSEWTSPVAPPAGIYAVVWHHSVPVADLLVMGDPNALLPTLPSLARRLSERAVLEHQVLDALHLGMPVATTSTADLLSLDHPPTLEADLQAVTIAVCTRGRPEQLRDCLQSISDLEGTVAEVLVVDNAPPDESTQELVAEFPRVRYVREPRRGLDWARNRALLEARTPIVAFTDDDAVVHSSWPQALARTFMEEPSAVVVTGLVLPAELSTPAQVAFEKAGGFGRGYRRQYFASAVSAGDVAARRYPGMGSAGTGANMAVRREAALALGGFDPALDVGTPTGGGGDLEFYFRVVAAGHAVVYDPAAVVRHRHRATMDELLEQRRGDGTGSYSIFVGAARNYGRSQYRSFLRFAAYWAVRHHAWGHLRSLLDPDRRHPALIRAESLGALQAVTQNYYRRARVEAQRQATAYPTEPSAPPLKAAAARPSSSAVASVPTIAVELAAKDAAQAAGMDGIVKSPEVKVVITADGNTESWFTVHAGDVGLTRSRLFREVATDLAERSTTRPFHRRLLGRSLREFRELPGRIRKIKSRRSL